MYKLFTFLIFTPLAFSQQIRWSGTTGDVSLMGAGTSATIQQPSSGAKSVGLEIAIVSCSVACDITQKQNGTAATMTAGTLTAITSTTGSPATTFWTASNVGSGTAVGGIIHLTAAGTVTIDLSKVSLPKISSTALNYTITISSITGTANITFIGHEQ